MANFTKAPIKPVEPIPVDPIKCYVGLLCVHSIELCSGHNIQWLIVEDKFCRQYSNCGFLNLFLEVCSLLWSYDSEMSIANLLKERSGFFLKENVKKFLQI